MNVVDVIIIALLILGGVAGFKAGVIKKLTDFIGMFVVIILAFYLKNYISVIMYENLPFFNFFGLINGIDALNILLYEVFSILFKSFFNFDLERDSSCAVRFAFHSASSFFPSSDTHLCRNEYFTVSKIQN